MKESHSRLAPIFRTRTVFVRYSGSLRSRTLKNCLCSKYRRLPLRLSFTFHETMRVTSLYRELRFADTELNSMYQSHVLSYRRGICSPTAPRPRDKRAHRLIKVMTNWTTTIVVALCYRLIDMPPRRNDYSNSPIISHPSNFKHWFLGTWRHL